MIIKIKKLDDNLGGSYSPVDNMIILDVEKIRSYRSWRRQLIGIFIHELVHYVQWHIIYGHNVTQWNKNEDKQEKQADNVQDIVLKCLLVG